MQVRGILSDEEDTKIWLCVCVCVVEKKEKWKILKIFLFALQMVFLVCRFLGKIFPILQYLKQPLCTNIESKWILQ